MAYLIYKILYWIHFAFRAYSNYQKGKRARDARDAKTYNFPAESQDVLKCNTIEELLNGQFSGRFSAKDVVNTYASRCYRIGRERNYTTEEMFDQALELAEERDSELQDLIQQKKDPRNHLGKLHGIPFSVKEHIWVEGTASTLGFGSLTDNINPKDSYIVIALKEEGGIPLVKGNIPEGGSSFHTKNNVWGEATNPWDNTRTCGGSSGGDAALIASNCIPFAIGSDMFGSLRVPSAFCGNSALYPTPERLYAKRADTYQKWKMQNFEIMKYVLGPITRSTSDLAYLYQILFSESLYNQYPRYPKLPFNKTLNTESKKLKIGILDISKISALSKTAERAMEISAQILEDDEHEVVNVEIGDVEEISRMAWMNAMYSSLNSLSSWFEYKDAAPLDFTLAVLMNCVPNFVIRMIASVLSMVGEKRNSGIVRGLVEPSAQDMMDFTMQKETLVQKVIDKWKELKLDAVIFPTYPTPAFKVKDTPSIGLMHGGYALAPLLKFPSGTVPITTVREDEQVYSDSIHKDTMTKGLTESMKDSKSMPIGIEIMSLPYKDEQILRIMSILEKDAKFHTKNPYPKIA